MPKLTLPEPDKYTLEHLAEIWGVSRAALQSMLASGLLLAEHANIAGDSCVVVTLDERQRFEAASVGSRPSRKMNPAEKRTLLALLGVFARMYYGQDITQHPYKAFSELARDAAAQGIELHISGESGAQKFKEAFEELSAYLSDPKNQSLVA